MRHRQTIGFSCVEIFEVMGQTDERMDAKRTDGRQTVAYPLSAECSQWQTMGGVKTVFYTCVRAQLHNNSGPIAHSSFVAVKGYN